MSGAAPRDIARLLVLVIALFCTACGGASKSVTRSEEPEWVQVTVVSPASGTLRNEEHELDNCSGGSEMREPLASVAQVEQSITVASQASSLEGDANLQLPDELEARLTTQVDDAYGEVLEAAESEVEETEMVAGPHTRYTFTIIWQQQVYTSTVAFAANGRTFRVPYTYTLNVPRLGSAKPGFCTG